MRLRNIPRAEGVLKECSQVIETPEEFRDHWASDVFQNDYPVHIEIGMGKGRFLMALAQQFSTSCSSSRKIHRSTTSESSATQASFSVLWKS